MTPANPLTILARGRPWIVGVVGLSFLVNLLMLTGPMYMLQVYDRVLSSRSLDTLLALSLIMAGLFAFMGVFDHLRGRALTRAGLLWSDAAQAWLAPRTLPLDQVRALTRETDNVTRAYAHPAAMGVLDILWMPLFLVALYFLHPLLAGVAVLGLVASLSIAAVSHAMAKSSEKTAMQAQTQTQALETGMLRDAGVLETLAATGAARQRWLDARTAGEDASLAHGDGTGAWQTTSKTFRLFFQSVLLGVGALLAVQGSLTPGAMIAGSILGGRALAPVDQLLSGLALLIKGKASRAVLLRAFQEPAPKTGEGAIPETPQARVETTGAAYAPQGRAPALRELRAGVQPGQCLAVFGPSGSGKSAALRVMSGAWTPTSGVVLFDGVPLSDWTESARARAVGHLGQDALLPEGTVAEIIKGFDNTLGDDAAIAAAKAAGVHEGIVALPKGYGERVEQGGHSLPYGLRRGLLRAQALRSGRSLIVLDDPTNGTDRRQKHDLEQHLKTHLENKGAVIMATEDVDMLRLSTHALVLDKGRTVAFGPIGKIVEAYATELAAHGDRNKIPTGLLPAVVRQQARKTPDTSAAPRIEGAPA